MHLFWSNCMFVSSSVRFLHCFEQACFLSHFNDTAKISTALFFVGIIYLINLSECLYEQLVSFSCWLLQVPVCCLSLISLMSVNKVFGSRCCPICVVYWYYGQLAQNINSPANFLLPIKFGKNWSFRPIRQLLCRSHLQTKLYGNPKSRIIHAPTCSEYFGQRISASNQKCRAR